MLKNIQFYFLIINEIFINKIFVLFSDACVCFVLDVCRCVCVDYSVD